jgi:O-antigen/teichoic acid export membrane protein
MSVSDHSREVVKGSLWTMAGSITFNLFSFFYVILVARSVSPDELGLFYLAFGMISVGSVINSLGLSSSLVRYVPFFDGRGEGGKVRSLLKYSYATSAVLSMVLIAAVWLSADVISSLYQNPQLAPALRLLSVFLFLSNLLNLNLAYLRGKADMRSMQIIQNIQNGLKLALTGGIFFLFGASVATLAAAYLLSFLIAMLVSFVMVARKWPAGEPAGALPLKQMADEILPFGIMLSLMQSVGVLSNSLDRILLGYLGGPAGSTEIVAVYSVASALATVFMTLPNSIGSIFLPLVSRLFGKNDLAQIRQVTMNAQRWSLFAAIPFSVVLIAFSSGVLGTLYGDDYRAGAAAMSILAFALMFRIFPMTMSLTLAAMRLVGLQLRIMVLSAVVNLALDLLLIPGYGMAGCALATLATCILSSSLVAYYSKKHFGYSSPPQAYRLALCGALTLALMLGLNALLPVAPQLPPGAGGALAPYLEKVAYLAWLGLLSGVSTAVFVALSIAGKCLMDEDVELLRRVMEKARVPHAVSSPLLVLASYGAGR